MMRHVCIKTIIDRIKSAFIAILGVYAYINGIMAVRLRVLVSRHVWRDCAKRSLASGEWLASPKVASGSRLNML